MKKSVFLLLIVLCGISMSLKSQSILYTMPPESSPHEGTWLQWPHQYTYGVAYRNSIESTWIAMTKSLVQSERVHIIAYNAAAKTRIIHLLTKAGIPLTNVTFNIFKTDDCWVRDNGPIFVYDQSNHLAIDDWNFNGWGNKTPFAKDNVIPDSVSKVISVPRNNLSAVTVEGGAMEMDGNGTFMATKSSILNSNRNPNLTQSQVESYFTKYLGVTNFIWMDGVAGLEITDFHVDGFAKFLDTSTIVTMDSLDLKYWELPPTDISTLLHAKNKNNVPYQYVFLPLTANKVTKTNGKQLAFKGSYINYYVGNTVVLVPGYNDPNDSVARAIIQQLYPTRTAVSIDVRNLYAQGGMVHCVTQQQPVKLTEKISSADGKTMNESGLHIYPNPNKGDFIIQSDAAGIYSIINDLGQVVQSFELNEANGYRMSISGMKDGSYMVIGKNDRGTTAEKMVIMK